MVLAAPGIDQLDPDQVHFERQQAVVDVNPRVLDVVERRIAVHVFGSIARARVGFVAEHAGSGQAASHADGEQAHAAPEPGAAHT